MVVEFNEINQSTRERNSQQDGNEESVITAVGVTLPNRDRSRTSIQILDQAMAGNAAAEDAHKFNKAEHDAPLVLDTNK